MNRSFNYAKSIDEPANRSQHKKSIQIEAPICVLSVGSLERGSMVHDALLEASEFRLSIATDYWGMQATPEQDDFHVAVLHDTLDPFELDDACRFIRHRWPHARILVVRADGCFLEDPLYDDRVVPAVDREALFSKIEQMSATWHDGGARNAHS